VGDAKKNLWGFRRTKKKKKEKEERERDVEEEEPVQNVQEMEKLLEANLDFSPVFFLNSSRARTHRRHAHYYYALI
jgi:hypothetical protein